MSDRRGRIKIYRDADPSLDKNKQRRKPSPYDSYSLQMGHYSPYAVNGDPYDFSYLHQPLPPKPEEPSIQAKLEVVKSNAPSEVQADQASEYVMNYATDWVEPRSSYSPPEPLEIDSETLAERISKSPEDSNADVVERTPDEDEIDLTVDGPPLINRFPEDNTSEGLPKAYYPDYDTEIDIELRPGESNAPKQEETNTTDKGKYDDLDLTVDGPPLINRFPEDNTSEGLPKAYYPDYDKEIDIELGPNETNDPKEDTSNTTVQKQPEIDITKDAPDEINRSAESSSKNGGTTSDSFDSKLSSSKGSGSSIPEETKEQMEAGFGTDFDDVKIHTDAQASDMSKEIGARAFTHGQDIYFKQGEFNNSNEGKKLLGHELTHTIQNKDSVQPKIQRVVEVDGMKHFESLVLSNNDQLFHTLNRYIDGKLNPKGHLIGAGASGNHVFKIQWALTNIDEKLKEVEGMNDGVYGEATQKAITDFQRKHGLTPDGVVGASTLEKLDKIALAYQGLKQQEMLSFLTKQEHFNNEKVSNEELEEIESTYDKTPSAPISSQISIDQFMQITEEFINSQQKGYFALFINAGTSPESPSKKQEFRILSMTVDWANKVFPTLTDSQRAKVLTAMLSTNVLKPVEVRVLVGFLSDWEQGKEQALFTLLKANNSALFRSLLDEKVTNAALTTQVLDVLLQKYGAIKEPLSFFDDGKYAHEIPFIIPSTIDDVARSTEAFTYTVFVQDNGQLKINWHAASVHHGGSLENVMSGMHSISVNLTDVIKVRMISNESDVNDEWVEGRTFTIPAFEFYEFYRHADEAQFQKRMSQIAFMAGGFGLASGKGLLYTLDAIETALAAADLVIQHYRADLSGSEAGRTFLDTWDSIQSATQIYGMARMASVMPKLIQRLGEGYDALVKSADGSISKEALDAIDEEMDFIKKEADKSGGVDEVLEGGSKVERHYLFEDKGYSLRSEVTLAKDGTKDIVHYLDKEGKSQVVGYSTISPKGELSNVFEIPPELQKHGISKAIYLRLSDEGFSSISSLYASKSLPVNYNEFMKVYDPIRNNKVEAAMSTPAAKALGEGWKPTNIKIKEGESVSVEWIKIK